MWGFKKKTRVAAEVILEQMRQQAAERGRDEGRPPVKNAWAPVLADSGTDLRDIRVECEEDDPEYVWRLKTMLENVCARVANQDATIGKQQAEIERLQEDNEWQEAEIKSLQKDNEWQEGGIERLQKYNVFLQQKIERLRDESAVAQENERLRAEAVVAAKAAAKVATLVEGLEVALHCPISQGLVENPVVSKVSGQTYSREDIEKWLKTSSNCPLTGLKMTHKHLVKNYAFGSVLDAFKAYQAPAAAPAEEEKPAE
jgi:cell division protein FtsB